MKKIFITDTHKQLGRPPDVGVSVQDTALLKQGTNIFCHFREEEKIFFSTRLTKLSFQPKRMGGPVFLLGHNLM